MTHADFYFSRGGGSILKEDPVEPVHDVLHRIADLLLIDRKAGIQHSLNGVRRVSKVITDAVEMVLCQDRLPFFGEDVVIEEPTVSLVGTASYQSHGTVDRHRIPLRKAEGDRLPGFFHVADDSTVRPQRSSRFRPGSQASFHGDTTQCPVYGTPICDRLRIEFVDCKREGNIF